MSRKYTLIAERARAMPAAKAATSSISTKVSGSHGSSGLPAIKRTIVSSDISIENWTKAWKTWAKMRVSRGNATLRTSPALLTRANIPPLVTMMKKFHGRRAHRQVQGEVVDTARVALGRLRPEYRAEHVAEDRDGRQRVDQRPGPAEERPPVLRAQLAQGQVPEQLAGGNDL